MEIDKFEEDFFVEIPFKSLFIEPLPNESVLHRKRLDIAESEDTSDSSKVFIDESLVSSDSVMSSLSL